MSLLGLSLWVFSFAFFDHSQWGKHCYVDRKLFSFTRAFAQVCFSMCAIQLCSVPSWRPCLGVAIRHGEALHPGPPRSSLIGFCTTNPTCIASKLDTYKDLFRATGAQVVALSETAATALSQRQFQADIRSEARCFWSPPVEPLSVTAHGHAHLRGKASGVGLLTKLRTRHARLEAPCPWNLSTRFLHVVLQLGDAAIQVVVIYGQSANNATASDYNNKLMAAVSNQLALIPLPWIVLGDFNMPVANLDAWPYLEAQGCRSLDQLHSRLHSSPMPPTCQGSTLIDNAILSAHIVPMVHSVEVLADTWFATHAPVLFRLAVPPSGLVTRSLRYPKSFVDLNISDMDFANMPDHDDVFQQAQTIEDWGQALEHCVHRTLQEGKGTVTGLSKAYRGRCQPSQIITSPITSPVRVACPGSYEPSTEVLTIATRRKVTQVRRVESLWRRLSKMEKSDTPLSPEILRGIHQEWKAVHRSHAFGEPFLHWILSAAQLPYPAWPLPSASWTYDVLQLVRYHTDAALAHDSTIYRQKQAFQRSQDAKHNHKQAFARVRGPTSPAITETGSTLHGFAIALVGLDSYHHEIYLDSDLISRISPMEPFALGTEQLVVGEIFPTYVTAISIHPVDSWPEEVAFTQLHCTNVPSKVADNLNAFWQPLWQRDPVDLSFLDKEGRDMDFAECLASVPAPLMQMVDLTDLSLWKKAIRKLKAHSARGIDFVSAQELKLLPDHAILSLARILGSYIDGFPSTFMWGITCPLSKCDGLPTAGQSRPITVLPQLYRLWAAVIYQQVAPILAQWMPTDITGFLPCRGAASHAYAAQWDLEHARKHHLIRSGVTLDLIKCFNCVRWSFAFHALIAIGFPRHLARVWILSLSHLKRAWVVTGQWFCAGHTSTGCPEGDQISVLVMLAISTVWCYFIRVAQTAQEILRLSAYADNWSWSTDTSPLHTALLLRTKQVTDAAGLTIDFQKTWFWASPATNPLEVQQALHDAIPDVTIDRKHSAPDLGFQLQYSSRPELGKQSERVQKGIKRLDRLQAMPHCLSTKEAMVKMSILPAIFHGCEIRPPSTEVLTHLRSKIASALVGSSSYLSPAVALVCTSSNLDPEFWVVFRLLCVARAFLLRSPESAGVFCHQVSRFVGTLQTVVGPASALGFVLKSLGWQLDAEGILHTEAFLSFPLQGISQKRVRRLLERAWMDRLIMMHTQRRSWFHFPDICPLSTRVVLCKFSDSERKLLTLEIAGGYQLAHQKHKWAHDADGSCEHCQQPDSRRHRLLDCPIGNEVRAPFHEVIAHCDNEGYLFPDFPAITIQPEVDTHRLLHFAASDPVWDPATLDAIFQHLERFHELRWYTDGSCFHSHSVATRYAAFAVVWDMTQSEQEREYVARRFSDTGEKTQVFQTVAVGRSKGEQDILRAELSAIASIILTVGRGTIHTDSLVAQRWVTFVLTANSPAAFAGFDHFDILLSIWHRRHHVDVDLVKVKAHQDLDSLLDPCEVFHALGNAHADTEAKKACRELHPDFVQALEKVHATQRDMMQTLEQLLRLHLLLVPIRAAAIAQPAPAGAVIQHDQRAIWAAFRAWDVPRSFFVFQEVDTQFLEASAFGRDTAERTVQWLREFVWPDNDLGPLQSSTGTTWVELSLSWMSYHRLYLPILRTDQHGEKQLCFVGSQANARLHGATFLEFGTMLQKVLDNTIALVPEAIWPECKRIQAPALYQLGERRFHTGIQLRPKLPEQHTVLDHLHNALNGPGARLSSTPSIEVEPQDDYIPAISWKEAQKRAINCMHKVRRARRASAD